MRATIWYVAKQAFIEDVFADITMDESRMQTLVDQGAWSRVVEARQNKTGFHWSIEKQVWILSAKKPAQTPRGNTFTISTAMIAIIQNHHT